MASEQPGPGRPRAAVAVAIPAYNEADGIGEFLSEIDEVLGAATGDLTLVVVDDASTDGTAAVLDELRGSLSARLEVVRSDRNRGHGATLWEAYHRCLELRPDYVLQVDGDGQFHGADLRRMLVLLEDEAHAVCGVRRFRQDPWFRMVMTRLVRRYVNRVWHVSARDPNCPLRGYEAAVLARLLASVPPSSLVPNLYLTIVAAQSGVTLLEVDVSHQVRRGDSAEGTGLGRGSGQGLGAAVPWRLVLFSLRALVESRRFRVSHARDDGRSPGAVSDSSPRRSA
jgi:dolichol-phosphate mannosyltransferase